MMGYSNLKNFQPLKPIGVTPEMGFTPYEKVLNRYYGGMDTAIGSTRTDSIDAYIVSYPKSGRTWLKLFLQLLYHKHCGRLDFYGNIFWAKKLPAILATHTGHYYQPWKKTVFVLRDPRDILVSFYYHVQNRGPASMHKFKSMRMSDFVRDKDLGMPALIQYYKRWRKRLKKCKQLLVIRYEDMISRDLEIFNNVHNFLELNIPINLFLEAVDFCRFDNLKAELAKPDYGVFAGHPELVDLKPANEDPNSAKIRRGVVGGYVDELTKDDIVYCDKYIKRMPREWNFYG